MTQGKTFLRNLLANEDYVWGESANGAVPGAPRYLTRQEVSDILREMVEADNSGRMIPPVVAHPTNQHLMYVALSTIFPEEQGVQISCAGLCYLQILGDDAQEGHVRVAALPSHFAIPNQRRSSVLILTREQLNQILPWDRTLQRLETCCVREVLQAYVSQMSGVTVAAHPYELETDGLPLQTSAWEAGVECAIQEVAWTALPDVFVPPSIVEELAHDIQESARYKARKRYPWRLFWLKTVVAALEKQRALLSTWKQRVLGEKLLGVVERIIAVLKGKQQGLKEHHFWVSVCALRRKQHCLGWYLTIQVPQIALPVWGF